MLPKAKISLFFKVPALEGGDLGVGDSHLSAAEAPHPINEKILRAVWGRARLESVPPLAVRIGCFAASAVLRRRLVLSR